MSRVLQRIAMRSRVQPIRFVEVRVYAIYPGPPMAIFTCEHGLLEFAEACPRRQVVPHLCTARITNHGTLRRGLRDPVCSVLDKVPVPYQQIMRMRNQALANAAHTLDLHVCQGRVQLDPSRPG